MSVESAIELRLEMYTNGPLPTGVRDGVTNFLTHWWPETWDVKVPDHSSLEHPAEWRAVIPLRDGETAENLHGRIETQVSALDPGRALHYRTRWSFQESPNHQEVYEVRWAP
jgi:hypothetical protein